MNACPNRLFGCSAGNHEHAGINPASAQATGPAQRKDGPQGKKNHLQKHTSILVFSL